jgi:pyruvate, water dikinase
MDSNVLRSYKLSEHNSVSPKVLVRGLAIGQAIACGRVRVISGVGELHTLEDGDILVTSKMEPDWRTSPDWKTSMGRVAGIVTDRGGRTSHAAITARELRLPAVMACETATQVLHTGQEVTISCVEEEIDGKTKKEGKVYEGSLHFDIEEVQLDRLPQTLTQIYITVGSAEEAQSLSSLPCDGIGVVRLEFIIANDVQIHPLALIHFDTLQDRAIAGKIAELTTGYEHKPEYFVDKLSDSFRKIAQAFANKPVIVRMSDFKSNEYAHLIGGKEFEPDEENPTIGWRGASRYYDERYRQAYHLECQAIKRVRGEGWTNIIPLIPFCRTPEEGIKVIAEMESQGLKRGENDLEVYIMCETPLNVLLADEFCQIFDGFSIGSNDLTQLIMGIDRDSERIAHLFDERNRGVKQMIESAITTAKKFDRKIGICGQAPTDYPELIPFLVKLGIDSITVSPDSLITTLQQVAEAEADLGSPLPSS